jgi:hypothetical protein
MENLLKLFVSARILKPLMSLCAAIWLTIVFLVSVRGVLIGLCSMLGKRERLSRFWLNFGCLCGVGRKVVILRLFR